MTLLEFRQKIAGRVLGYRLVLTTLMLSGLVGLASAGTFLNDSITPILTGVTLLFTPLLAVIVAGIPVLVTLAVVGFILGILAKILGKI